MLLCCWDVVCFNYMLLKLQLMRGRVRQQSKDGGETVKLLLDVLRQLFVLLISGQEAEITGKISALHSC